MSNLIRLLSIVSLISASQVAMAGPITLTSGTSSYAVMENFSSAAVSQSIFDGNGVSAAETFAGLTVNDPGGAGFEYYSGSPSNPLTLEGSSGPSDGVYGSGGLAAGLAGGTAATDIGEGVIAFLFDYNITELGMLIGGAESIGIDTTFYFYDSLGGLVDTISTNLIGNMVFTSTTAFAGVAVENTDDSGQFYDDFRFASSAAVPEPSALILLGLGLLGLGRRQSRLKVS